MMITVEVNNRIARVSGTPQIICGNSSYTVAFQFDEEWDEYDDKTAHFRFIRNGTQQMIDVNFTGDSCAVPALADVDLAEIGVSAGSIRTTSAARVSCLRCITDIQSATYTPQTDVYNALMSRLQEVMHPVPELPAGYVFVVSAEGHYIVDASGEKYIVAKVDTNGE